MEDNNRFDRENRVTETVSFPKRQRGNDEKKKRREQAAREEEDSARREDGAQEEAREKEKTQKKKRERRYSPMRDPDHTLNVLIFPAILCVLFLFFVVCFILYLVDPTGEGTGWLGSAVTRFMLGLFGYSAVVFLPALLIGAFRWRRDVAQHRTWLRTVFIVLGVLGVSVLFYTFGMPEESKETIGEFYACGKEGQGGGFLGSLLGLGLNKLVGPVGTAIVVIVLLVVLLIALSGIDVRAIVVECVARARRRSEAKREDDAHIREMQRQAREEETEVRRKTRMQEREEAVERRREERLLGASRRKSDKDDPALGSAAPKRDFFDDDVAPVAGQPGQKPAKEQEKTAPRRNFRFVDVDIPFDTEGEGEFRESYPSDSSREPVKGGTEETLTPVRTAPRREMPKELRAEPETEKGPATFEDLAQITVPAEEAEPVTGAVKTVDPLTIPHTSKERRENYVTPMAIDGDTPDVAAVSETGERESADPETDGVVEVRLGQETPEMKETREQFRAEPMPRVVAPAEPAEEPEENASPYVVTPVGDNPFAYVPVQKPAEEAPQSATGAVHVDMNMVVVKSRVGENDGVIEDDAEDEDEEENEPVSVPAPAPVKREYKFPPIELLKLGNAVEPEDLQAELDENAQKLVDTLASFKVPTHLAGVSRGARITRYELVPETGTRVRSIANLADDITMNMASEGIRIEAPIPGKPAVGIEVPNKTPETVFLRQLVSTVAFRDAKTKTTVCLGSDVTGDPVYADIGKMPHLLVAGATGMGKSVCINTIITSILYKATPEEVKLILVDPKKVEFNMYSGIPHLLVPVVTDAQKAAAALNWAVKTMEERFDLIEEAGVRDCKSYNASRAEHPERPYMSSIIIIIDELNDLMLQARDSVETSICRIAQKARAAGIHLIIGTQRPSVDVITGVIKANIPSRIAFHVSQQVDSRTILDNVGAEKLLNNGDMLYYSVGFSRPKRVQGAFISDEEVAAVVGFLREQGGATYDENVMSEIDHEAERAAAANQKKGGFSADGDEGDEGGDDPLFYEAVDIAIDAGKVSTSYLQRKMSIGYGKAAKLIDRMQEKGIVSEPEGQKPRSVLITRMEFEQMRLHESE